MTAAERLEDYVRRTVDAAPALTDDQRQRLADLLRPTASTSVEEVALDAA